jgi:salicylate hydroxylase
VVEAQEKILSRLAASLRIGIGLEEEFIILILYYRNGLTGEVLATKSPSTLPLKYETQRVRRTNLQAALIKKVPVGVIELRKRLKSLEDLGKGGVKLKFEDGTETEVDLVVGGDGIRSVVRQHLFPEHATKFTGLVFISSRDSL